MNIIEKNLKFKSNLSYGNKPNMVVLHHAEASKCTIEDIHSWHLERGWSGCGYHFFIKKDGSVYRGRAENVVGSHCLTVNSSSIGICAEGDYMKETMPEAQKKAIVELSKSLCAKYNFTIIRGHKELYSTDCPGTKYPLEEIKKLLNIKTDMASHAVNSLNILELQKALNTLGITDYEGKRLVEDGINGKRTISAVEKLSSMLKQNK